MPDRRIPLGVVLAATFAAGTAAGSFLTLTTTMQRLDAVEVAIGSHESDITRLNADRAAVSAGVGAAMAGVERIEGGVARIKLTGELEPESIFGGIQAFVETGTTAHGCIASVSETNVGNLGPFYVLCTPRSPIIEGSRREGLLLQIRTATAGGSSGDMFPPWAIVEITLWQPGATQYRAPVPCVIGAPDRC